MTEARPSARVAATEVLAGLTGTALGFAVGGPAGALVGGATPAAISAVLRYGDTTLEGRRQRAATALTVAADLLGGGVDDLETMLADDPARLELLARILEAAGHTPLAEKIPALGRVLAAGLGNSASLDGAFLLAAALNELEAPHVQVLQTIAVREPPPDLLGQPQESWGTTELADLHLPFRYLMISIISTLDRHALIWDMGENVEGGRRWVITEIGTQILDLLHPNSLAL